MPSLLTCLTRVCHAIRDGRSHRSRTEGLPRRPQRARRLEWGRSVSSVGSVVNLSCGLCAGAWAGGLLRPELLAALLYLGGDGVGLDELRGLLHQLEELSEVLAEDEQAGLFHVAARVVTLAFGKDEEVIAVAGLLHLRGVRARADGLEVGLEQDLRLNLGLTAGGG